MSATAEQVFGRVCNIVESSLSAYEFEEEVKKAIADLPVEGAPTLSIKLEELRAQKQDACAQEIQKISNNLHTDRAFGCSSSSGMQDYCDNDATAAHLALAKATKNISHILRLLQVANA